MHLAGITIWSAPLELYGDEPLRSPKPVRQYHSGVALRLPPHSKCPARKRLVAVTNYNRSAAVLGCIRSAQRGAVRTPRATSPVLRHYFAEANSPSASC